MTLKENLDDDWSVIWMWIFIHDVRDDIYRAFITLNEIQFETKLGLVALFMTSDAILGNGNPLRLRDSKQEQYIDAY